jgi:hypothetical protein
VPPLFFAARRAGSQCPAGRGAGAGIVSGMARSFSPPSGGLVFSKSHSSYFREFINPEDLKKQREAGCLSGFWVSYQS